MKRSTKALSVSALFFAASLNPYVGMAASSQFVIYDNQLENGFVDWSWTTNNLANTSPVYSGSDSISVSFSPWGGLYLETSGVNTSAYSSLSFYVNGGSKSGQNVGALVYTGAGNAGKEIPFGSYCAGGEIPANSWALCTIPLSALGAENETITGVAFQEQAGLTLPTMYFDQIVLEPSASPSPTPTVTPSPSKAPSPSPSPSVALSPSPSASSCVVNRASLIPPEMQGKIYAGYQGWFRTIFDGAGQGWGHWGFPPFEITPTSTQATIDLWPDVSDYPASVLANLQTIGSSYSTGPVTTLGNGQPTQLFSNYLQGTTDVHLSWMQQYGIDGAFVQRFVGNLTDTANVQILKNVMNSAEKYNRHFVIMYDITGGWSNPSCYINGGAPNSAQGSSNPDFSLTTCLEADITKLSAAGITSSSAYLKVTVGGQQKPLVAIFGYGLNNGVSGGPLGSNYIYNTTDGQAAIQWLKTQGYAVMGGTPTFWASAGNCGGIVNGSEYLDTLCDRLPKALNMPTWTSTFQMFDIISPWMVGRESVPADIDNHATTTLQSDVCTVQKNGQGYLPVIFPGYSFFNTPRANGSIPYDATTNLLNETPRDCGKFLWRQFSDFSAQGPDSFYVAMFDEMNEGTAILKTAATAATSPKGAQMVTLDIDGCDLTSDWYLQVANSMASGGTVLALGKGAAPTENLPLKIAPVTVAPATNLIVGNKIQGPGVNLAYLTNGDLTISDVYGNLLWDTGTTTQSCATNCSMSFQADGNLVLYNDGKAYWASNTSSTEIGTQAKQLVILDHSPYLEIVDASGDILWSASTTFPQGFDLSEGQFVQLGMQPSGTKAFLQMAANGNLTMYSGLASQTGTPKVLWSTNKSTASCSGGCTVSFQGDGNLVVYNGSSAIFASNTVNSVGKAKLASRLKILNQAPYLEVTDAVGDILWLAP